MCRGHEGRHFLVPYLDELDFSVGAVQRAEDAVDAVPGVAVDAPDTPLVQALDKKIADRLTHGKSPGSALEPARKRCVVLCHVPRKVNGWQSGSGAAAAPRADRPDL